MKKTTELRDALPPGSVMKIAEKLSVSHSLVSLVLAGKRANTAIIDEAITIIEEVKAKKEEQQRRLKEALS